MYNSKIEINFEAFMNNVYWVSILEGAIWILLFALFLSSPATLALMWLFIPHLGRAIVGFILLKNLPNTFTVIENLKDYESQSLDDIQNQMLNNFKNLLSENEDKLRPYLIAYFILTIVNILIDIIMFFVLLNMWGNQGYEFTNIVILAAVIVFYVCDIVYFDWMGSLKFSFPEEMLKPIRQAVIGFISQLKDKVISGFGRVVNRLRGSSAASNPEGGNNNQANVNQPQQQPQLQ